MFSWKGAVEVPDHLRPFSLLLVCTGNICRSPTAERLFRAAVDPSVDPQSAGTHALVGQPISEAMALLLDSAGAPTEGFAARQLREKNVKESDLVLAMSREHRAAAVELWPAVVRRAFTLREFARLLQSVDREDLPSGNAATRLSAAIPLAAQRRQMSQNPEVDDIADPYGLREAQYLAAFQQIQEAVLAIADVIGSVNPSAGRPTASS